MIGEDDSSEVSGLDMPKVKFFWRNGATKNVEIPLISKDHIISVKIDLFLAAVPRIFRPNPPRADKCRSFDNILVFSQSLLNSSEYLIHFERDRC